MGSIEGAGMGELLPAALFLAFLRSDTEDDQAFLTTLYIENSKALFTFALRLCGHQHNAEDAVQDAFVSLISQVSRLRAMQTDRLKGYLYISVKHAVMMNHRKENRQLQAERKSLSESSEAPTCWPRSSYTVFDLMEALKDISQRDQTLLQMKFFLHLSDQEIASRLQVKTSSVRKMVARAKQRLIQVVDREKGDGNDD